jgi:hypothetical protein
MQQKVVAFLRERKLGAGQLLLLLVLFSLPFVLPAFLFVMVKKAGKE